MLLIFTTSSTFRWHCSHMDESCWSLSSQRSSDVQCQEDQSTKSWPHSWSPHFQRVSSEWIKQGWRQLRLVFFLLLWINEFHCVKLIWFLLLARWLIFQNIHFIHCSKCQFSLSYWKLSLACNTEYVSSKLAYVYPFIWLRTLKLHHSASSRYCNR